MEDENLVKNGIFVVTKSTCPDLGTAVDFLLRRTAASTRSLLQDQLQVWAETNRLAHMHHPITKKSPEATRAQILDLIARVRSVRVSGMNVSVLYPLEMKGSLIRMFTNVMEGNFNRHLESPLETLSEYDEKTTFYSSVDFWRGFGDSVCTEDPSVGLLKEFCIDPYNEAHRSFERGSEGRRQAHLRRLGDQRLARGQVIEMETARRTQASINSLVPKQSTGAPLPVDFAYHKDVYETICGTSLADIYRDPLEQEVVRRSYADFMAGHIQDQMMVFMAPLTQRLAAVERSLLALSAAPKPVGEEMAASGHADGGIPRLVPAVAVGYEADLERFMRGVLVYKPNPGSDVGRVDIPIAGLADPLAGTFDLSRFSDVRSSVSIHTGYKKNKIAANADKVEIWVCPKFLVERELYTTANHFHRIIGEWDSPIAYFWTWGSQPATDTNYDYLINSDACIKNELNLREKWYAATPFDPGHPQRTRNHLKSNFPMFYLNFN